MIFITFEGKKTELYKKELQNYICYLFLTLPNPILFYSKDKKKLVKNVVAKTFFKGPSFIPKKLNQNFPNTYFSGPR